MRNYFILCFCMLLLSCSEEDELGLDKESSLERARAALVGQYFLSHSRSWENPEEYEEYGYEACESEFIELHEDGTFKFGDYVEDCEKKYLDTGNDTWDLLENSSLTSFVLAIKTSGKTEKYSMEIINGEYFLKLESAIEPDWGEGFTGYWTSMWMSPL